MDKCPSGLRSTPRKRVRANPSASSNLALSACNEGWNNGVSAFFVYLLCICRNTESGIEKTSGNQYPCSCTEALIHWSCLTSQPEKMPMSSMQSR